MILRVAVRRDQLLHVLVPNGRSAVRARVTRETALCARAPHGVGEVLLGRECQEDARARLVHSSAATKRVLTGAAKATSEMAQHFDLLVRRLPRASDGSLGTQACA